MATTSDGGILSVVPYGSFTAYTPALPQFYWDVYSGEQRIKHMCYEIEKVIAYANMLGVNLNATHDDVVTLQQEFEQFKDGEMLDFYEKQIEQWIKDNTAYLYTLMAKQVFFGLDKDGYFVAYIPDSWADIQFDTGQVYGRSDYGCLILRFSADGSIDNTYSYQLSEPTKFQQLLADIETTTKRTDAAYDTLFANLNQEVKQSGNL